MICESCAAGADLTADPNALAVATRAMAESLHGDCKGCTCQHRIPSVEQIEARYAARTMGGLARIVHG